MDEFLAQTYYGSTIQQYALAGFYILAGVIVGKIVYYIFKNVVGKLTAKTKTKLDDILLDMLEEPAVLAMIMGAIWLGLGQLTMSEGISTWVGHAFRFVLTLNIAWFITRLFDALFKEYLVPLAEKSESDLDDQLLPVVRKGVKFIVWSLVAVIALNNAGYDVGAALAGLGIGGLALAMAGKDTVANMFGGLTVFTDGPFKINDRVKVEGFDGIIKEIGIRSTKLATLDGPIVTIPNATFSDSPVENVSMEPSRKVAMTLGLTYDMKPDQMRAAMKILRKIGEDHENTEETIKVAFKEFGDFSMNILFIYYIKTGSDILGTMTEINLAILDQFTEEGLDMAFPTQTIINQQG